MYPRKIYEITHKPTGRIYVGSSHTPDARIKSHLSALRCGNHPVEDMQADYDQCGGNLCEYTFSIIGEIGDKSEDHKEYDCMLERHSNERGRGYNYKDKRCRKRPAADKLLEMVRNHEKPEWAEKMATVVFLTYFLNKELTALAELKAGR